MTNTSTTTIIPIPVTELQPNCWNPNRMNDHEFQELLDEVRRLGRIPKPIVVRSAGQHHEIVDGEHNWRAAREIGLVEVPCEIIEADDFEAMLQTYKRNQHGQHSPVLEGRLFRDMCDGKGFSSRELALAAGVSKGTIRNRKRYAQAAGLRNCYAQENRDSEIDAMQVRHVRVYVDLPQPIGDLWLDAGGRMGQFGKCKEEDLRHIGLLICRYDLVEYLDPNDFQASFARLAELVSWLERNEDVPGIIEYIRPIAQLHLPGLLAWVIPLHQREDPRRACIEPDVWRRLLRDAVGREELPEHLTLEVAAAVCELLEDADIDPSDVFYSGFLCSIEAFLECPDFIRDACFMTLDERMQLGFLHPPAPLLVTEQAKQDTVAAIREERLSRDGDVPDEHTGPEYIELMFLSKLRTAMDAAGHAIEPLSFNREGVLRSLDESLEQHSHLREATIDGRPVPEVFQERICCLRTPELVVLRTLLHGSLPAVALGAWLDAVYEETVGSETPRP